MYHKHHTRGIIISSRTGGDSNRQVSIFTENFGLISAKVQGSRNTCSKLRAGSQDFSFGDFSLIHGKTGWRLVSVRIQKNIFETFRESFVKLKIIVNILNLVKKLIAEESHISLATTKLEVKSGVFIIVSNFFDFLETAKEKDIALAECLTLVRILHSLGYMKSDPEISIPVASSEIALDDLEMIAPRRFKMVALINESLKAT